MSHKNPELTSNRLKRRWLGVAALGAAVVAAGVAGIVDRANDGDPTRGWPAASASLTPPADAPYLASPEAPKPGETHKDLGKSKDPGLKAVAALEKKTGYRIESNMLFAGMPRNPEEATAQADEMAARLKEYANRGVKPVVVMEPTYADGAKLIDTKKISDAKHQEQFHQTMDVYFGELRTNPAGLTDEQMGTWVPFPEPNIPEWAGGNTDPGVFKKNFTVVSQNLKAHFRDAKASVMLDSATYANNDWNNPDYGSEALKRYVSGIPEGLIDSVGFQGFPFSKNDNPNTFLNAQPAAELAEAAHTKNIWLNTGSYGSIYNEQTKKREAADTLQRAETLVAESKTAATLQQAGFNVSVNIFAAPASSPDAPDWSYKTPMDQSVLSGTLNAASAAGIPVSVFAAG
jgi:hypothetical protein